MKHIYLSSLMASLGLLVGTANAMTLSEAYQLALKNDIEFAQAGAVLEGSLATAQTGYAGVLPQVSFSYGYSYSSNLAQTGNIQYSTVALNLSQNLFNMSSFLNLDISGKKQRLAETVYTTAKQDLINRVVAGYLAVVKAKSVYAVAQNQEKYLNQVFETTKVQSSKGLISRVDFEQAKSQVSAAKAAVLGAKASLNTVLNNFAVVVGRPVTTEEFYTFNANNFKQAIKDLSYETNVDNALANNLSLRSLAMTKEIARLGSKVSVAAMLPTISLNARLSNNSANQVMPGEKGWGAAHRLDRLYVGVSLNIPIFMGGQLHNAAKASAANYKQSSYAYDLTYSKTKSGLQSNLLAIQANKEIVDNYSTGYEAAASAYKSRYAAFKYGVASLNDMTNTLNNFYSTAKNLEASRFDYVTSVMQQKVLAGTLNEADLETLSKYLVSQENLSGKNPF